MFAILSLVAFRVGENVTGVVEGGQTLAFMVLCLSQIVQAYNMRSDHSLFSIGVFSNGKLNRAALVSILLVALVLFTPLRIPFGLISLPGLAYVAGLLLSLIPFTAMEFSKTC